MDTQKIEAIKARTALGRQQGGNPTTPDSPFGLYHQALDDLECLIAELEAKQPVVPTFDEWHEKATAEEEGFRPAVGVILNDAGEIEEVNSPVIEEEEPVIEEPAKPKKPHAKKDAKKR